MKKQMFIFAFALSSLLVGCTSENAFNIENDSENISQGNLNGYSQKGPVLAGASVVVQELDHATLLQTGKSFRGKVISDNGEFVVENVSLNSPYVLLEVNGYFRNEVTGKNSDGAIFMKALADVSEQKNVNINLLTHLEYERIQVLLEQKKISFDEAKRIADSEIFASFYADGDFGKVENLNIFGDSDGDAALLAFNILLLETGSEATFMENFAKLGTDLAEDGVWDDSLFKVRIADGACDMDYDGKLSNIRKNIESWKIAKNVASFERYVSSFWENVYGLGTCDASNLGKRMKNSNASSVYYGVEFTCNDSKRWSANLDSVRAGCDSCGFMIDPRDGHKYRTIKIAGLNWMAENLAYSGDGEGTIFHDDESYGLYYASELYPIINGAPDSNDREWTVYTRSGNGMYVYALRTGCPDGWRLPTREDFVRLIEITSENNYEQLLSENEWNLRLYSLDESSLDESIAYLTSTKVESDRIDFSTPWYSYYIMDAGWDKNSLYVSMGTIAAPRGFIRCVEGGAYERKMLSPSEVAVDSVVDERDGKVYKTLQFGNQLWMAKNMEYAVGNSLIDGEAHSATFLGLSPTISTHRYDVGRRYYWNELQEACPDGWRVPSRNDVKKLLNAIGGGPGAAPLLSKDGIDAQDIYGFSALSTELEEKDCTLSHSVVCIHKSVFTRFWTADSADGTVYHWHLDQYDVTFKSTDPADYLPVRCVKDAE